MSGRPHLLLTRPQTEAERTARELEEAGFRVTLAPVMAIEPLACAPLATPPEGVLLTSQHAAPALRKLKVRKYTPVIAVGPATADAAKAAGYTQVQVADGHALSLVPVVKARLRPPASLAYLRGAEVRHDLQTILTAEGYRVESRRVYRTTPLSSLPDEAQKALGSGTLDAILFYSARTVEHFAALAPHGWTHHRVIAVSETVAEAARRASCEVVSVVPLSRGAEALDTLKTLFY